MRKESVSFATRKDMRVTARGCLGFIKKTPFASTQRNMKRCRRQSYTVRPCSLVL